MTKAERQLNDLQWMAENLRFCRIIVSPTSNNKFYLDVNTFAKDFSSINIPLLNTIYDGSRVFTFAQARTMLSALKAISDVITRKE